VAFGGAASTKSKSDFLPLFALISFASKEAENTLSGIFNRED